MRPEIYQKQSDAVTRVISTELHQVPISTVRLVGGYGGHVFDTTVQLAGEQKHIIVKLTDPQNEESFEEEDINKRVYGMRLSNFKPAYDRLVQSDILVPKVYAFGDASGSIPYSYQILELLEGISLREHLASGPAEHGDALHHLAGDEFGKLHHIVRPYQGWVDLNKTQAKDWKTLFFTSLRYRIGEAVKHNRFLETKTNTLTTFVLDREADWRDPEEFVLSHVDGFQGMVKEANGEWQFTGVIDIEDHTFTDQRFVLAGYELSQNFERRVTPKSFWDSYGKQKSIPKTYESHKPLFQLYYLLSWLPLVYEEEWIGQPEDKERVIGNFEKLILGKIGES